MNPLVELNQSVLNPQSVIKTEGCLTKRPLRCTESPKGASWVTVDEAARSDDEPTEHGRAQPCVPEGGEYRTAQLLHRWAFRKSTSLLVYRHPHPIGVPFGGGSLQRWVIRRFVGQALLTLRLFGFAPFGDAAVHTKIRK